eukprot:CAMPEP_0172808362 /NCGR_PEP_ID=MMETSP1075-20121228/7643_1 /TAXON_ID=2916 /ORGANISM="Ceratium fusus, Strain PA161109" /LENGTH=61 /DNA_ID=CAMNT_0013647507 /DNA_START=7 /DNA_END=188 /DNA_ORIENTATION=+
MAKHLFYWPLCVDDACIPESGPQLTAANSKPLKPLLGVQTPPSHVTRRHGIWKVIPPTSVG